MNNLVKYGFHPNVGLHKWYGEDCENPPRETDKCTAVYLASDVENEFNSVNPNPHTLISEIELTIATIDVGFDIQRTNIIELLKKCRSEILKK